MTRNLWMLTSLIVIANAVPALAGTSFVDLTPQKYNGADTDLSGISLTKFGVNCEENGGYVAGDPAYISWENQSGRSALGKGTWGVQRYTIHFRVKDRKGKVIHEEDFKYSRGNSGTFPNIKGQVVWGAMYPNRCARNMVRFSKQVDLSFTTVEYWLTKIEWMKSDEPPPTAQLEPDKIAFAVEAKPKEQVATNAPEKPLMASYVLPAGNIGNFALEQGVTAYIADKTSFTQYITTSPDWNDSIKAACVNGSCGVDTKKIEQDAANGNNLADAEDEELCVKYGCIFFVSKETVDDGCSKAKTLIRLESCRGGSGLFNSEGCQPTEVMCHVHYPASYGKKIQPGSENLFVATWFANSPGIERIQIYGVEHKFTINLK